MTSPLGSSSTRLQELARQLIALTTVAAPALAEEAPTQSSTPPILKDADAVITHIEVSDRQGVGKLVQMMFLGEPNILSIRSTTYVEGIHNLGDLALCISHADQSPEGVIAQVCRAIGDSSVRRILCVPYFPDDLRTALALHEIFGAPLCTYIMDDQNICVDGIPDELMQEALAKSALCLGISPEMSIAYKMKWGSSRMWYMPPLVPGRLIPSRLNVPKTEQPEKCGVLIGNIWGQRWLDLLRGTVRDSGVAINWYCNGGYDGVPGGADSLFADSIVACDPLQDDPLVEVLREARFAVLPSGMLDETDDRRFIAQLSLPSRLVYMIATAHVPVIVLGNRDTASAHFVEQFGVGLVADYERKSFVEAVETILRADVNLAMRRKAAAVAGRFTDAGAAEWIWQSLAAGKPMDRRFEDLMPTNRPDLSHLGRHARSSLS